MLSSGDMLFPLLFTYSFVPTQTDTLGTRDTRHVFCVVYAVACNYTEYCIVGTV